MIEIIELESPEIINEKLMLASRGSRFMAALLDTVIVMCFILPIMSLTGGFDGVTEGVTPSVGYSIAVGFAGLVFYFSINGRLLLTKGQTIGKKALKIKVVTTEGELPPAFPHFAKRYAVFYGLGYIPYVGNLLSFINLALIFDKRKLAGHDRFAGTKVVEN